MKAGIALTAVLILAGLNAGCAVAEIRGTVVEMEIEHNKQVCTSKKSGKRKVVTCATVAECYEMDVRDSSGEVHEFCADPDIWGNYKVGDMYPHKGRD